MLIGQAMGLGVWGHGSIWPQYVLQRVVSKIFRTLDQATAPVCMTCDWWRGRMFM
jgi:hypothetical protein